MKTEQWGALKTNRVTLEQTENNRWLVSSTLSNQNTLFTQRKIFPIAFEA